jgi:hypothetical protein
MPAGYAVTTLDSFRLQYLNRRQICSSAVHVACQRITGAILGSLKELCVLKKKFTVKKDILKTVTHHVQDKLHTRNPVTGKHYDQ